MPENNSLLGKISLLTSANVHSLLDNALKANSPAVIEEEIRRAEQSRDQLNNVIASMMGNIRVDQDSLKQQQALAEKADADAQALVALNNMAMAGIKVKAKLGYLAQAATLQKSVETEQADVDKLNQAMAALNQKITDMKNGLQDLTRALEMAKTEKRAVRSIGDMSKILEDNGTQSYFDAAKKQQATQESALDLTLQQHAHLTDPSADPDVAAELARMQQRLTSASGSNK